MSRGFVALTILAALFVAIPGPMSISAQEARNIDTIVDEILENQDVRRIGNVKPNEVEPALLEELGSAVMDEMAGDESHREWMEQMMGGAESPDLAEAHRWMGYRYILSGGSIQNLGWGPGMMGPWGPRQMPRWRRDMLDNGDSWSGYGVPGPWIPTWVWILGAGLVIAIVVLLVLLLRRNGSGSSRSTALDVLRSRYARGEISREEFQRIKSDLS